MFLGDLLYEDFCDSFSHRVDYQLLTPQVSSRDEASKEVEEDSGSEEINDDYRQQLCIGKYSFGRRDRLRAKICRCTRAIFRAVKAAMPRKKTDPENFKGGTDYFLEYAYGEAFDKRSYWYHNPDPHMFFTLLFNNASGGEVYMPIDTFERLFHKRGDHKSSGWILDEDLCGEMGLRAQDLMREVNRVKTSVGRKFLPRVVMDSRFLT